MVRSTIALVLVQLAGMFASMAIIGGWLHETALDTDTYVSVVGPLIGQPAVLDSVADWAAGQTVDAVEERSGLDVSDDMEERSGDAARQAIDTNAIANVWVSSHRNAHSAFVALLRGEQNAALDASDGAVVLDLSPVLATSLAPISESVPELQLGPIDTSAQVDQVIDGALADSDAGQVTLWRSSQLGWLQAGVRFLDRLADFLPFAALGCALGALAISPRRPRTARQLAITVGVTAGVVLLMSLGVRYLTGSVIGDPWAQVVDPSMRALTDGLVLRAGLATGVAAILGVLGVVTGFFSRLGPN